jgi:hypothetical protein
MYYETTYLSSSNGKKRRGQKSSLKVSHTLQGLKRRQGKDTPLYSAQGKEAFMGNLPEALVLCRKRH